MTWEERLRPAAYTTPTGTRFTFVFEDVSQVFEKKTGAFDYPEVEGTYIQDSGHTGRRFPLRIIFWGDDHDTEAAAFEEGLREHGVGFLEHPIYGSFDVVPFGAITRRDRLKTAANQTVFEIEFWETLGVLFPSGAEDAGATVEAAVEDFNAAQGVQFAEDIVQTSAAETAGFRARYETGLANAQAGLQKIADTTDAVRQRFNAVNDSINNGINVLIADPLALAAQTAILIELPARAGADIWARLTAYSDFIGIHILGNDAVQYPANDSQPQNNFRTDDLYVSSSVSGMAIAATATEFRTKPEALAVAETILNQLEAVTNWRDDNFTALGGIDTGESYEALQALVAVVAGFLINLSFSLLEEKKIVLTHPRTPLDLAAELYGDGDAQLDFLISSNDLGGQELFEIPRGREIVYFA